MQPKLLTTLQTYSLDQFRADVVAGLTVAIVALRVILCDMPRPVWEILARTSPRFAGAERVKTLGAALARLEPARPRPESGQPI